MTDHTDHVHQSQIRLRLIDGMGGEEDFCTARRAMAARPMHMTVGASELAAEMAIIYGLSLLRDVSLTDLENPHHIVHVDPQTSFSLNELLCELRSLPWLDRHAIPSLASHQEEADQQAILEDEHLRRASRWNEDGQLTLRMLLRGATTADMTGQLLSRLTPRLEPERAGPDGTGLDTAFETLPSPEAALDIWQGWLESNLAAAEAFAGAIPRTLCDLAEVGYPSAPGRASLALSLSMAATMLDPVPTPSRSGWAGAQLMRLMTEAVSIAVQAARTQSAQLDRMRRPAVLAARISLMTGRDDAPANSTDALARQVLEDLRRFAPRLLSWVARKNAIDAAGSPGMTEDSGPPLTAALRMRDNLMLPTFLRDGLPLHPSDAESQSTVAGACMTILKAVFAGPFAASSTDLRTGQSAAQAGSSPQMLPRRPGLSGDLDKLASNMVLGRLVSGGYFFFENRTGLRKGERIAMALLSEVAEAGKTHGDLGFISFDGKYVRIAAQPQRDGMLRAEVLVDGCTLTDLVTTGLRRSTLRAV